MNKAVETIIWWRHNLRRNIGDEAFSYINKKGVYITYLEILSEVDYGIMMDKEYALEWDGKFFVHIQQYPKKDLNILCRAGLLKPSEEIPGYHELILDSNKIK